MKVIETVFEGLFEFEPRIFRDDRGDFLESYNRVIPNTIGNEYDFVQDNQSRSTKGVLRALHFQNKPYPQVKLIRVIQGKVQDVVVDIRPESKTFGQHKSFILDDERCNIIFVPPGFAHGFLVLEDCIFSYKCTKLYNKESESGLPWNDPELGIEWLNKNPLLSDKDLIWKSFKELKETYEVSN